MAFWSLFMVATMPVLQILLISFLGAVLASGYINILTPNALRDINKVVYVVFSSALVFTSLARTVTLQDIISWWFMPVNIGLTFFIGAILGWIAVKILRPERHLEDLVIACCSAGNLGTLPLILVPPMCDENGSPFGDPSKCKETGMFFMFMQLGAVFIWTHTYSLMQKSSLSCKETKTGDASLNSSESNSDEGEGHALKTEEAGEGYYDKEGEENKIVAPLLSRGEVHIWEKIRGAFQKIVEELMTPPILASIVGFVFGVIPPLKSLIIGENAPLRVIQDSSEVLGDAAVPCSILILGGNLTEGLHKSSIKRSMIAAVVFVRYVALPIAGIGVYKAADAFGLLPEDPLFGYVLLLQFALPPAISIGTMAQLFDVGREECSVIFLWTYLIAAVAVTVWSTVFMSLLF